MSQNVGACESNESKMPEVAMTKRQLLQSLKENLERLQTQMLKVSGEDEYQYIRQKLSKLLKNAKGYKQLSEASDKIAALEISLTEAEIGDITRTDLDIKLFELMQEVARLIDKEDEEEFRGEVKNVLEEILTGSQKGKTLDEQVDFLINALF